jgi:hypothetical protein
LNKKQQKRQFTRKRDDKGCFQERYDELDEDKLSVSIKMPKQCVKRGILGSYVLMDSWFVTDTMLKEVRKIRKGKLPAGVSAYLILYLFFIDKFSQK